MSAHPRPLSDLTAIAFDDSFVRTLPADPSQAPHTRPVFKASFSFVKPTPVKNPHLLAWSASAGELLGIARPNFDASEALQALAGNRILPGMRPYAARYGGHQFGHWAGQLGDGRAMTLGEILSPSSQRWDIQLKGAGPTPYSRRADGRAVLRSSIREFLCSEAMHHLGIPTTRALCLVGSDDQVLRDMFYDGRAELEPCAIVTRVAPSFIRFGNFQIHTASSETTELRQLANYVIEEHFRDLDLRAPDTYAAWFREVCKRTAVMIAHWQRVGFVHGVMNTDNMSILGLTIDYGPYGWLDVYDHDWTPNTTDAAQGRYRFGNQPAVALWNLAQLGQALLPLLGDPGHIEDGLKLFRSHFSELYRHTMAQKIGLPDLKDQGDSELLKQLEELLQLTPTDMSIFYRKLAAIDLSAEGFDPKASMETLRPAYYTETLDLGHVALIETWLRAYAERSQQVGLAADERKQIMNRVNPKYVLRNYLSQEAIEAAHVGDRAPLDRLLQLMQKPYDEQPEFERFAAKRPQWAENKAGCSALSCSS